VILGDGQYLITYNGLMSNASVGPLTFTAFPGSTVSTIINVATTTTVGTFILTAQILVTAVSSNGVAGGFQFTNGSPGVGTMISSNISIVPTFTTGIPLVQGAGLVEQYRPVAMTAFLTSTLPTLLDGGEIAASWVPGETFEKNFFVQSAEANVGQLQQYECVRRLDGAYSGPVKQGAFVWYRPEDLPDYSMYTCTAALANNFPALAISGVVNVASLSPMQTVSLGRLEVCTVYEAEFSAPLLESICCVGSQSEVDTATRLLAGVPYATQNGKHLDTIKSFLINARKWYNAHSNVIDPLIGAAVKVGATLL